MPLYGYHGTNVESANGILKDGFLPSQREHDWLGEGVYFFQDAPVRALRWAIEHHPGIQPAVICSELELDNCLDMLDTVWFEGIQRVFEVLAKRCDRDGIILPRQTSKAHRLDCAVLNLTVSQLINQGFHVSSLRAAFVEGDVLYQESALYNLAHVQIAVRDLSVVRRSWLMDPGGF